MATRPVRFEFMVEKGEKLKYVHNLPQRLITPTGAAAQSDPRYASEFAKCLQPIMQEHEAACQAASSQQCSICGTPTVKVLQTPMSWLHITQDPFINVWVNAVCSKTECEMRARQQIQDLMAVIMGAGDGADLKPGEPATTAQISPCIICGKVEDTKKCGQCKVVAYCGKEHQKADWKVHKRICAQLTR